MGIRELLTKYGNIDVMWFDVMLTRKGFTWEADKVREMIRELNPDTMVNARLVGQGDYETPELYIPLTSSYLCVHFPSARIFSSTAAGISPSGVGPNEIKRFPPLAIHAVSIRTIWRISLYAVMRGSWDRETTRRLSCIFH